MKKTRPRTTHDHQQSRRKLNQASLNGEVTNTLDCASLALGSSLIATWLGFAAPPPTYSADEQDSATASSEEDSDEFTTRPADKRNGRKRAKPKPQSAGFEMPRISSRNGKELPNYNEAEAFNFSDESEGEYVSAKQKRVDDRESDRLPGQVLTWRADGEWWLTECRVIGIVAEPEDAVDGVFGHKRDDAHRE